jgi:hypothetical protein
MQGGLLLACAFVLRGLAMSADPGPSPAWMALWAVPTGAYVAGMSLITASLLAPGTSGAGLACGLWACCAVTLECIEHPASLAWLMRHAPTWLFELSYRSVSLRQAAVWRGFQPIEIAAALTGAVMAFYFLRRKSS